MSDYKVKFCNFKLCFLFYVIQNGNFEYSMTSLIGPFDGPFLCKPVHLYKTVRFFYPINKQLINMQLSKLLTVDQKHQRKKYEASIKK
jgi:hypothetical protein